MSNGKRRIALFGAAGVLVAALIISTLVVGGNIFQAQARGTLTIQIMDKPTALTHLNITIDSVSIQDENGTRVDLTLKETPFYFDLLTLQDVSKTLSQTQIPAANYTMIRMHVLTANATYPDGTDATLKVPSDTIKVLLNPQLNLQNGGALTVLIDLQPDDANTIAISHSLNLRPVIKAITT